MISDVKTMIDINLTVQVLLLLTVLAAAYLAKRRNLVRHCNVMRVAVGVQLLAVFTVMLPVMLGYLERPRPGVFQTVVLIHHSLGVLVVLLWVYINLAVMGRIKLVGRLTTYMRAGLIMWVVAFLLGVYLYYQIYLVR